jgi:hypothetical protein
VRSGGRGKEDMDRVLAELMLRAGEPHLFRTPAT